MYIFVISLTIICNYISLIIDFTGYFMIGSCSPAFELPTDYFKPLNSL